MSGTWRLRTAQSGAGWRARRTLPAAAATQPPGRRPLCQLHAHHQLTPLLTQQCDMQHGDAHDVTAGVFTTATAGTTPINGTIGDWAGTPRRRPSSSHRRRRCPCRHGSCSTQTRISRCARPPLSSPAAQPSSLPGQPGATRAQPVSSTCGPSLRAASTQSLAASTQSLAATPCCSRHLLRHVERRVRGRDKRQRQRCGKHVGARRGQQQRLRGGDIAAVSPCATRPTTPGVLTTTGQAEHDITPPSSSIAATTV